MENSGDFADLLSRAELAFEESSGCPVVLSHPEVIKDWRRSRVLRCKVESSAAAIPSLILKQIKEEPERGFSDWASLAFLEGQPGAHELVPRFLGGDPVSRLFLMGDLGEGRSLQGILTGGNPTEVLVALRDLASRMARLHSSTVGKEDAFDAIRSSLPGASGLGRKKEAENWLVSREKIFAWFEALGCQCPAGFADSLAFIAAAYADAEGFLAFSHGDPAPSNNHFSQAGPRLIDFEYGGFRHALYDITAWNVLCPLPVALVEEMRRCFRDELARGFPLARDELRFSEAWACLCAYRAWAILTWIPPDVIRENRPWADSWGMREAVFVALSRMAGCAPAGKALEASHEAALILLRAMGKQWPSFDSERDLLPKWS